MKHTTARIALPALLVLSLLGAAGCSGDTGSTAPATTNAPAAADVIEYQVEGTAANATITFSTKDGGATTATDASLPWKQTIDAAGLTNDVGLMAVTGQGGGDVTCRVVKAGKVLAEQKASGVMAVASCTATP